MDLDWSWSSVNWDYILGYFAGTFVTALYALREERQAKFNEMNRSRMIRAYIFSGDEDEAKKLLDENCRAA